MKIRCEVCHKKKFLWNFSEDVYYEVHGGAAYVCKRCAKTRMEDIIANNELYSGSKTKKKDPNCQHQWVSPYRGRFYCPKCGAQFNMMCGCGGSMYYCEEHYAGFMKHVSEEYGSLDSYLDKQSW